MPSELVAKNIDKMFTFLKNSLSNLRIRKISEDVFGGSSRDTLLN